MLVESPGSVRVAALSALLATVPATVGPQTTRGADRPLAGLQDSRVDGLVWTFVRIQYRAWPALEAQYQGAYGSAPWAIDFPAAEQNLTRRVRTVTSLEVADPIVLTLEDPQLWQHPWLYFVEPGTMNLSDVEVPILREFLLRGGTATFDDFHGPIEWSNFELQMKRVFPDRPIIELDTTHPVFHCFYSIGAYPQVPGLGSFLQRRTWEKGGYVAHLRGILDDDGPALVLVNWNTDMGDGWEWSNAQDYPGYVKFTTDAYRMMIVYSLTH
jgi:hypothetical protein